MNEQALCEFIMENKSRFYNYAYRYTRNAHDAQDVLSEAVYKALKAISRLKKPESVQSWFYSILTRCAIDFTRKNQSHDELPEVLCAKDGNVDEEVLDLSRAIDALDEKYRIILILRFFEDLKLEQISETLGLNVNTVKSRLYSALDKLRITM